MTIERKVGMGIAGQPSGGAANVADVFSTYLYKGNGSSLTINNGIDLAGEGGMTWIKIRNGQTEHHSVYDTERGATNSLATNLDAASSVRSGGLTSFNSNGFSVGDYTRENHSASTLASWTFRKKEKFFDVVTWSGNGVAGRQISHSLGSVPAMLITKTSNDDPDWKVYHSALGNAKSLKLNATDAEASDSVWNSTTPTSTVFTVGSDGDINSSGRTYVAYLFADNSSEDAEDQMIKCGSFTEASSGSTTTVNLGWEPQWVIAKSASDGDNWHIIDSMRGFTANASGNSRELTANGSGTEGGGTYMRPTSTGFIAYPWAGSGGGKIIYMAIRAPMMKEPEAATEVYKGDYWNNSTPYTINTGFTTDLLVYIRNIEAGSNHWFVDRLRGETARIDFSATTAESTWTHAKLDVSNGYTGALAANGGNKNLTYAFSRAKGCFDILNYTGNSSSSQNVPHQLGVIPEFVINVRRDTGSKYVVSTAIGTDVMVGFNDQGSLDPRDPNDFFDTPTDTLLKPLDVVNSNGKSYINYLFATLAGVSKCGKYIGNGSSQTIDCGFAAGARFIMLKCVSVGSNQGVNTTAWYVWDSARGIVSGNDPYFKLNTASAMVSNTDSIDPTSSGFIVNQNSTTEINNTGRTYIYLAIA